jgi:hypothetical protein
VHERLVPASDWHVVASLPRLVDGRRRWRRFRVAAFAVVVAEPFTDESVLPLVAGRRADGGPCLEPTGDGFLRHVDDHTACVCDRPVVEPLDPSWCEACAGVVAPVSLRAVA